VQGTSKVQAAGTSEVLLGYRMRLAREPRIKQEIAKDRNFAIIEPLRPIMTFRWLNDSRQGPEAAQKLLDSAVNSVLRLLGVPTRSSTYVNWTAEQSGPARGL
jgi:hypothetical protein